MKVSPGLDVIRSRRGPAEPGVRADREERWAALGAHGATVWLTGLPGAGKTTVAAELERRLTRAGRWACVLDGDELRATLTSDLGFSREDRRENVRRISAVARTIADAGGVAIVAVVAPYAADRDAARAAHAAEQLTFAEVWVDAPAAVCAARDPKGLYAKAASGKVRGLTGHDAPYEPPTAPALVLRTHEESVASAVDRLEAFLRVN